MASDAPQRRFGTKWPFPRRADSSIRARRNTRTILTGRALLQPDAERRAQLLERATPRIEVLEDRDELVHDPRVGRLLPTRLQVGDSGLHLAHDPLARLADLEEESRLESYGRR